MSEQSFDNRGQISLWKNETGNLKAPTAKGHFIAHRDIREGEQIEVSLWRNQSDNPNAPVMKGKIQDKFVKQEPADQPFVDSSEDIPF
jgi:hypothetical protein|tara:strand:- start:586 stop:849 length:264 start_codon:yes stop_codon:yes gene_type:complete